MVDQFFSVLYLVKDVIFSKHHANLVHTSISIENLLAIKAFNMLNYNILLRRLPLLNHSTLISEISVFQNYHNIGLMIRTGVFVSNINVLVYT